MKQNAILPPFTLIFGDHVVANIRFEKYKRHKYFTTIDNPKSYHSTTLKLIIAFLRIPSTSFVSMTIGR